MPYDFLGWRIQPVAAVLAHLAHALPHIQHLHHNRLLGVVAIPRRQAFAHPLHGGLILAE